MNVITPTNNQTNYTEPITVMPENTQTNITINPDGTLNITVTDEEGKPVPYVPVVITDNNGTVICLGNKDSIMPIFVLQQEDKLLNL